MTGVLALARRSLRGARRRFDARPLDTLLGVVAVVITAYAVVAPLTAARYPPITDLPMLASITSVLRHWLDPAWHFQDEFELQLTRVPTLTYPALGAVLALVFPIAIAMKISTAIFLLLLPAGLAVYCKALKKSPEIGVLGAFVAWGTIAHWGFISFLGSVGLTLMGVGLTFMVLERATARRTVALSVVSTLLFFTHVSAFPPYALAVAIAVAAMAPLTRRVRPVLLALAPPSALFAVWWFTRPELLRSRVSLGFESKRFSQMTDWLFHSYRGSAEEPILVTMLAIVAVVAAYSAAVSFFAARSRRTRASSRARRASVAALAIAAMFLGLYLAMPLEIGIWALVYPREIVPAALFTLGALPALPRSPWLRAPALAALLMGVTSASRFVAARFATFDGQTKDFEALAAELPEAPKLGYMMFDRTGSEGRLTPLLHLPAWVQAEKGGWLSFHFAIWEASPIRFRTTPPMDVPPPTPTGFERHPERFDIATRGKYFDWFLVRSAASPEARFLVDPTIRLQDQRGEWWLFHRQ